MARARSEAARRNGSIEERGSALRVRPYAGIDPVTGKQQTYKRATIQGSDETAWRKVEDKLTEFRAEVLKQRSASSSVRLGDARYKLANTIAMTSGKAMPAATNTLPIGSRAILHAWRPQLRRMPLDQSRRIRFIWRRQLHQPAYDLDQAAFPLPNFTASWITTKAFGIAKGTHGECIRPSIRPHPPPSQQLQYAQHLYRLETPTALTQCNEPP